MLSNTKRKKLIKAMQDAETYNDIEKLSNEIDNLYFTSKILYSEYRDLQNELYRYEFYISKYAIARSLK